jgi:hypothetical protein
MLTTSCGAGDVVLEARDVQFFHVIEAKSPQAIDLQLSGLAMHSSMAVERTTTLQQRDSLAVMVHLTAARAGTSGTFAYTLPIPTGVNTVSFGNARVIIWQRGAGPVGPGLRPTGWRHASGAQAATREMTPILLAPDSVQRLLEKFERVPVGAAVDDVLAQFGPPTYDNVATTKETDAFTVRTVKYYIRKADPSLVNERTDQYLAFYFDASGRLKGKEKHL